MSESRPGEWPTYSAYRQDDGSDEVISDPPRRKPGTVLAWILLFHLTIIGWTVGYLRGAPGLPIWLLVIGLIATVAAALCLDSLWVPRSDRVRGTIKKSKGSKSFGAAALMVMVLAPPAMVSMGLSSLYTLTVMRPTEATVVSAERVKSGKYNYVWQATVDLGDGRPHQVRLGSSRPDLNERVTVRTDPAGFAAPRGNTERPIDVAGPAVLGLPGLIFGWYVVIRHLRGTRPAPHRTAPDPSAGYRSADERAERVPVYPGSEPEEPAEEPDLIPNLEPEPEVVEVVEPPRRRPMMIGLWAVFNVLAVALTTCALLLDSRYSSLLILAGGALMVAAGGCLIALRIPRLRFWEAADVLFTRKGGKRFNAQPARYALALTTGMALAFGIAASTGMPTALDLLPFPQSLIFFAFAVPGILYDRYLIKRHLRFTAPGSTGPTEDLFSDFPD